MECLKRKVDKSHIIIHFSKFYLLNMLIRKTVYIGLITLGFIFTVWVYTRGTSSKHHTLIMNDIEFKGRKIWNQKNCISCHQIYGLGGYLGPDLTNIVSKKGIDYTSAILKYGTGKMPYFNFSNEELKYLISYLKYIDKTGSANPKDYKINWYGSFERK